MLDPRKLRLVTLSENTANWLWLLGEWGWSMLVQADGFNLLFDTGLRVSATFNAQAMGIDLACVDKLALSHGHVDHTGGLRDVLELMRGTIGRSNFLERRSAPIDIVCHPDVWGPKYIKHGDPAYSFRGIPFVKAELEERQGARFVESREPVWLTDDIIWSGEVPMRNDYETIAPICFLKKGEGTYREGDAEFAPDPLQQVTGMDKVHLIVGGTHLIGASDYQMHSTIDELKRLKVARVGVSHCTGLAAASRLAVALGPDVFFHNNAGNVTTFP